MPARNRCALPVLQAWIPVHYWKNMEGSGDSILIKLARSFRTPIIMQLESVIVWRWTGIISVRSCTLLCMGGINFILYGKKNFPENKMQNYLLNNLYSLMKGPILAGLTVTMIIFRKKRFWHRNMAEMASKLDAVNNMTTR